MKTLNIKELVKLRHPVNEEEAKVIYKITNYNEVTKRVYIEPVNLDVTLPSQELVGIIEIENI